MDFNQSILLLSPLNAPLLARQELQTTIGFSIPSKLVEGWNCFWNHPKCGHPRAFQGKPFDFDSPFSCKNMRYQQKVISVKSCTKFHLFVDHFIAVQLLNLVLLKNLHSLLSVSDFCFRYRANFPFSVAISCSAPCLVTALALRRVSVQVFNKKWNPQLCQGFLPMDLVLLSSNRNCGMRAAHFHQMSHTYHLGQCYYIYFSHRNCETFDH